jgi:cell division protein FtsI/penicillin-binding protein 2
MFATVGYPSYDNNELVNNFNNDYYMKIDEDPTAPMINRPLSEQRAPGSTLKMITSITALEKGALEPNTRIYDGHTFTAAGRPYLSCWSAISHGSINVTEALEVSCNYFFCEATYRLGNMKTDTKMDSINALDEYMTYFGLNNKTGVEIGETTPEVPTPDLKYRRTASLGEADRVWFDGDTVSTSIGQGYNNFSAANMAKYIMTLATKGARYQVHLVNSVRYSVDGQILEQTVPNIEIQDMPIKDTTWDVIYEGMRLVIEGSKGTGRSTFDGFPIRVAGKTGTAQENTKRNDHSSFGGFAPYDDPQIAIYVSIPFGDTKAMPALASQIAREVIAEYFGINSTPQHPDSINDLVE